MSDFEESSARNGRSISYEWRVLGITSIAFFMSPFDASVVNVALPAIQSSLDVALSYVIWIPAVYLLVIASLETTLGRIGDIYDKRTIFEISLIIFVIGSAIAGLSFSISQLILARIVQALGAAGMDAMGFAILTGAFRSQSRGRAFGINQMTIYIGLTTGPVIGGLLVQSFGWRSIFYVNIPIGLCAMILTFLFIRKEDGTSGTRYPFDFLGAITLTSFLSLLLLILNDTGFSLSLFETSVLFVSCVVSFALFVFVESRVVTYPMLDLKLFTQNRLFAGGAFTSLMNYLTVYGTLFVLSLYLQSVLGYSPVVTGSILLPQPIFMVLSSPIAGTLSDRISAQYLSSLGMGLKSAAFLFLTTLTPRSSPVSVIIPLVVIGIGHGFFSSPNLNSVMSSVGREKFGVASGTMGTIRQAGQSIGVSIMGGLIASHIPSGSINFYGAGSVLPYSTGVVFVGGMRLAFLLACSFCAIGVFTSLMRGKSRPQISSIFDPAGK